MRRTSEHGEDGLIVSATEVWLNQVDHSDVLGHPKRISDTIRHPVDICHGRTDATVIALVRNVRLHAQGVIHETQDAELRQTREVRELLVVPGLFVIHVRLDLETLVP